MFASFACADGAAPTKSDPTGDAPMLSANGVAAGGRGLEGRRSNDPNVLFVSSYATFQFLDPAHAAQNDERVVASHLFEGLTIRGPDGELAQGVAERWERSADQRHFRFHLRQEAVWSDGRPVLASDFVGAWTRVLHPETQSRLAAELFFLKNASLYQTGRLFRTRLPVEARSGADPTRTIRSPRSCAPT